MGVNITNITLISHGNALKNRRIGCVWYWWYWKQKITSRAFCIICRRWWKKRWMKGMPPSGCSDNAFELFQWLEQLVPISGYPPKVPFLSLESAIHFPRKCHWNETKVPSGLRRPYGRVKKTVRTGWEDRANRVRVSGRLTPRRPPRNRAAGGEPIRGGRRVNARRAPYT